VQSSVTWTLGTNFENLTLTGSSNINGTGNGVVNIVTGNTGDNSLDGGSGADTLIGGTGNDTYTVDNASDVVTEQLQEGTDTVLSSVTHTLASEVENLTLTGGSAINGTGNELDNIVTGNTGANTLSGSDGFDTLDGGDGLDHLTGGNDADIFVFHSATAFNNIDVVTDFTTGQGDVLDLRDVLTAYDPTTMVLTDFVRISDSGADSKVEIDRDGTGSTYNWAQIATLSGVTGLTDEDALVASGNLLVH